MSEENDKVEESNEKENKEEFMDQYKVVADKVAAKITILDAGDYVPHYKLERPRPSAATRAILDDVREKTIAQADITTESFEDANQVEKSREIFRDTAKEVMEEEIPHMDEEKLNMLIGNLIHEMLGMGDVEILLEDNNLEEIVINNAEEPAWVYHKDHGWLKTDIHFDSEDEIYNYASEIGRGVGKNISSLHPLLDAHLPSGDRTNATLSPISTQGNTITIRKFARDPWTITDFIKIGTISPEMAAFLWLCIQYEMNVIISGGTGTGKCLTPDSKLLMADGSRRNISEVVEGNLDEKEEIEDGWKSGSCEEIVSMDESYSLEAVDAEKVWKREAPEEMIRVKTHSGRSIETTPEHPFFTNREGRVEKLRADQLKEGDYIPSPRKIEVDNEDEELDIGSFLKKNRFQKTSNGKVESKRGKEINIPDKVSEDLAEVTGLIVGDGHVHTDGLSSCRVELHNSNKSVLSHFDELVEEIFEVETSIEDREDRVSKCQSYSHVLTTFFREVMKVPSGEKSGEVAIPQNIIKSSDKTLGKFLRGYFEAEAHVNAERSNIEISSKSEEIIRQVAASLKRFGVFNRIEEKDEGKYHRLYIGPECLETFQKQIGFISTEKNNALNKAVKGGNNSNRDLIPCEELLRKAKESGRLHDREIAERSNISRRSVSRYLQGERTPSTAAFKSIESALERRMRELEDIEDQLLTLIREADNSSSREESRDKILAAIESGKIKRKDIEDKTSISSGLISHWKNGSIPSSGKMQEVQRIAGEELNLTYEKLEYKHFFERIRAIRTELKVTPTEIKEETGIDIEAYENNDRETKKERLKDIIEYLLEECKDSLEALPKNLEKLRKIGNPDIRWDGIEKIERFQPETDWVYDLTVPENHTFVANDLIAHNTSLLNVLTPFMPPSQRIISIEDTREVSLPEFLHWVPMTTREQNPDGQGEVSMQDLLVNSLRMRPDRILVGEIRRKKQAEVLFEAMQTGHSVYSTLHADTAETTVKRMTNPPIDVPKTVVGAVDLNVVMFRDRRRNFRRVLEIAEVIDEDEDGLNPHTVYDWNSQEDAFYKQAESREIKDKLGRLTGMTDEEIEKDIDRKTEVLEWLVKKDVDDLERVGRVVAEYYAHEEDTMQKIRDMEEPEDIIPDR